jgi:hypothetical protein
MAIRDVLGNRIIRTTVTGATANSTITETHGLDTSKIVSVTTYSKSGSNYGNKTPNYTFETDRSYKAYLDSTNYVITLTAGQTNVSSVVFEILISD